MCVCIYMYTHVSEYIYTFIYVCVYIYEYIYVHIYIYIYVCIHMYTYIYFRKYRGAEMALMRKYRARLRKHRTLVWKYMVHKYSALVRKYKALLQKYRAVMRKYRALSRKYAHLTPSNTENVPRTLRQSSSEPSAHEPETRLGKFSKVSSAVILYGKCNDTLTCENLCGSRWSQVRTNSRRDWEKLATASSVVICIANIRLLRISTELSAHESET